MLRFHPSQRLLVATPKKGEAAILRKAGMSTGPYRDSDELRRALRSASFRNFVAYWKGRQVVVTGETVPRTVTGIVGGVTYPKLVLDDKREVYQKFVTLLDH